MNACEHCEETFPNITELYKHKHRAHRQQSLALHNHKKDDSMYELDYQKEMPAVEYRKEQSAIDYRNEQPAVEYKRPLKQIKYREKLPVQVFKEKTIKRKRDYESDSDDFYKRKKIHYKRGRENDSDTELTSKRYRRASDSEPEAIEYKPEDKLALVPYVKRRRKKTKRKFIKAKSDDESDMDYKRIENYNTRIEQIYKDNILNQKEQYENKLSKRDDELDRLKKRYEEEVVKRNKEFEERETQLKKELDEHKENHQGKINEIENHYQNQLKLLQEKIKSMEENKASFKPLSDAIFNCITIEEIFKIKKLVRNREFDELIKNHLDTLQKLFLSLSFGVIPICQPQRDVLTENQKKLIEKIETSAPSKARKLIIQNRSEIVAIFDIIDQSLELAAVTYDRFRKL